MITTPILHKNANLQHKGKILGGDREGAEVDAFKVAEVCLV
jgi:hypothetical protein